MQALPFIKPLGIVDDRHLGLSRILNLPMVYQLVLSELKQLSTGAMS
jgi:hypothetical protein